MKLSIEANLLLNQLLQAALQICHTARAAADRLNSCSDSRGFKLLERTAVLGLTTHQICRAICNREIPLLSFRGGRSYYSAAIAKSTADVVDQGGTGAMSHISSSTLLMMGDHAKVLAQLFDRVAIELPALSPAGRVIRFLRADLVFLRSDFDAYAFRLVGCWKTDHHSAVVSRVFYGVISNEQRLTFRRLCIVSPERRRMTAWHRKNPVKVAEALP